MQESEDTILPRDKKWPFLLRFPIGFFGICLGLGSQTILWKRSLKSPQILGLEGLYAGHHEIQDGRERKCLKMFDGYSNKKNRISYILKEKLIYFNVIINKGSSKQVPLV